MKKLILFILLAGCLIFITDQVSAVTIPFGNLSNNSGVADLLAEQFYVDVTEQNGGVLFEFFNDGNLVASPINSVITGIYFQDLNGRLTNPSLGSSSSGVNFYTPTSPPTLNFAEGGSGFIESFGFKADKPAPHNGIGVGGSLGILFDITAVNSFSEILSDFAHNPDPAMRIGIRVQDIGISGESDSFMTVPEPTTILLMGCGLLGLAGYSRKKIQKKIV